MLKYPWEQELEEVEARDRAAEKTWKSAAQPQEEDMSNLGFEYLLYFQTIRGLRRLFCVISLLAIPKIVFVLQGSGIQQNDVFAWSAYASLGNVDSATRLHLGFVDLTLQSSPILGLLDAMQLALLPAFAYWFCCRHIPRLLHNPELRTPSAASYSVQVDGLPPRLHDQQANDEYDFQLLRHFEQLLRSQPGVPPGAMVCEAALVRDFSGALLVAENRARFEAELNELEESGKVDDLKEQRLRQSVDALTQVLKSQRMDEAERPVWRAYLVLGSREERAAILRLYRFSALPLLGPMLQSPHLRLQGKWPLRVSPAPEPGEICWAHCRLPGTIPPLRRLLLPVVLLFASVASVGLSLLLWQQLLGTRGAAASQCSPSSGLSDTSAPCLAGDVAHPDWHTGCDCVCLPPALWRTDPHLCQSLDSGMASAAVLGCWLVAEGLQALSTWLIEREVGRWRTALTSDLERLKFAFLTISNVLIPFIPTAALLLWKVLLLRRPNEGLAAPLMWEVDRGWYLHASPAAVLWVLGRWLSPLLYALTRSCWGQSVLQPWERWASLSAAVAISTMLQPALPHLAPLAVLGLSLRHWADKRALSRGWAAARSGTPHSTSVRAVRRGLAVLWLSAAGGAAFSVMTAGKGSFPERTIRAGSLPSSCLFVIVLLAPLVGRLWEPCWNCSRIKGKGNAEATVDSSFQEAWLVMKHNNTLASYQIHEHPDYRGGTLFKELQPDVLSMERERPTASSAWGRNLDYLPSLALVGDKAPSRSGK